VHRRQFRARACGTVLCLMAAGAARGQTRAPARAADTLRVELSGHPVRAFTARDLARLPRDSVDASAHDAVGHYSGVRFTSLLRMAGFPPSDSVRGPLLATYVLVEAADGYRVVFAMAELDESFTDRVVLLADRVDGHALPPNEGPWRLIVPGEKRPARWIRQVTRVVIGVPVER
jgi:hypothetical protein